MQGNRASSGGEGEVSWFFSSCGGKLGYILDLGWDDPSKLVFVQQRHDSCLVTRDNSGISSRIGRAIWKLLEVSRETQCPFLFVTVILGFLSIFNKSLASSPFEALNSVCVSSSKRDVMPPVKMRRRLMAFSMVSTRDSDILSSCEMKDDLLSSQCREIRHSFKSGHLSVHSTWGSKLRVSLTYLLLRAASSWGACGKLAYVFSRSQGISSHLKMIWGSRHFPRDAVLKLVFL